MQPPETEPTTWPSSQMASVAPIGRGLEPQVLIDGDQFAAVPAAIQPAAVFNTSRSMLSMGSNILAA